MPSLSQLSITLIVIGGFFSILNWIAWVASLRSGKHVSGIPLIGGVLILVGMLLSAQTRTLAWIGLLVDPGTFLFLLATPAIWRQAWSTSRFNLLEEYLGQTPTKSVRIRLFRGGAFTMQQRSLQTATIVNFVSDWRLEDNRLLVPMNGQDAAFEVSTHGDDVTMRVMRDFNAQNAFWDYALGDIALTRTHSQGISIFANPK